MKFTPHREERIDRFEREIVLRTSRSIYLAFAGIATLAFAIGLLVLLYGITPTLTPNPPPEPAPPASPSVSADAVKARLGSEAQVEIEEEGVEWEPPPMRAPKKDGVIDETPRAPWEDRLQQIAELFDPAAVPWESEVRNVCTSKDWFGKCRRWRKEIKKKGAYAMLMGALRNLDDGSKLRFLDGVFEVARPLTDIPTRFLAVSALCDMKAVYGLPNESLTAVKAWNQQVAPPAAPAAAEGENVELPPDPRALAFEVILAVTKRGTPERDLAKLLAALPAMAKLFVEAEQATGPATAWAVLHETLPEEFSARLDELQTVLASVPEGRRLEGVHAYGGVLRSEIDAGERAYRDAQRERQAEINEDQRAAAEARDRKDGARKFSVGAVLGSLSLVAIVGLFLGLLAVERNTRTLGAVLERLAPPPEPLVAPEVGEDEEAVA